MKKTNALKNVPVSCVEEIVDNAMESLPCHVDLSLEENRIKLRNWMVRICGVVVAASAEGFTKAASSAIEEAAALAINPQYHQERKRRREKYKALRALNQVSEKPKNRAQAAFDRMSDATVKM